MPMLGQLGNAPQVIFALRIRQPDYLERMVSLHQPVGVVIDGHPGPPEQASGRVVFAEN